MDHQLEDFTSVTVVDVSLKSPDVRYGNLQRMNLDSPAVEGDSSFASSSGDALGEFRELEPARRTVRGESEVLESNTQTLQSVKLTVGSNIPVVQRSRSCPELLMTLRRRAGNRNIFPDVSPRSLRIAEVKSWRCPWMTTTFGEEQKQSPTAILIAQKAKRPTLKLKLENMPTTQEAEDLAQQAADRKMARRSMAGTARINQGIVAPGIRLRLNSLSSGDDDDDVGSLASPTSDSRLSIGSQWSPTKGKFITKNMCVSEAGISSPDSTYLHLQYDLRRVKELGRGGSGVVHKAIHVPTLKVVAVKDVPVYGKGQRRQMVRELHALHENLVPIAGHFGASTLAKAESESRKPSPYIVSFYDAFVDKAKNCVCMVMEYMDLCSLQDLTMKGGCTNEALLSRIAYCVLQGLHHIHENCMVHRDIKPHNLLMNRLGDVKITDFGLARTLNDTNSATKTFVGTLLYMAPERIGGGDYSYPADIWSFGLSLVTLILGKYPLPTQDGFFGLVDSVGNEDYFRLPATYSEDLRDMINKCLQIDPAKRASAGELLEHPFITKYDYRSLMTVWKEFTATSGIAESHEQALEELAHACYEHQYNNAVKYSFQTQSEFGLSIFSRLSQVRRPTTIQPIEKSLQIGLAQNLGLSPDLVHSVFKKYNQHFNMKLAEEQCFSPQSWTSSPGYARRQQFLGHELRSQSESTEQRSSMWRRLQDRMKRSFAPKSSPFKAVGGHL